MNALKSILLVEDNTEDVELTLAALEQHKLANQVVVTRDGAEALEYLFRRGKYAGLPEGNPALVLLDIKMPKVDGLQVLRNIREDDKLKMIPVVILTSSGEERDMVESYRLGVNAYVVKPVRFNAFIDAVKELGVFWAILNEPPPGSISRRC